MDVFRTRAKIMTSKRFPIGCSPLFLTIGLALGGLGGCTTLPNDVLRQYAADDIRQNDMTGDKAALDQAHKYLAQAVEQEPTDAWAQYMLGQVDLRLKNPLAAESCFEQALVNRMGTLSEPPILDGIAQSLLDQGDKSRLAAFLIQQAHDRPTVEGYLRQAKFLARMGDADGAALAFKKAARIAAKSDPTPYLAAAKYYGSIGDKADQVLALRRAYTADHDSTEVLVQLHLAELEPGPALLLPPQE
jgi:tetratricopeptide (TPR) repeat protein